MRNLTRCCCILLFAFGIAAGSMPAVADSTLPDTADARPVVNRNQVRAAAHALGRAKGEGRWQGAGARTSVAAATTGPAVGGSGSSAASAAEAAFLAKRRAIIAERAAAVAAFVKAKQAETNCLIATTTFATRFSGTSSCASPTMPNLPAIPLQVQAPGRPLSAAVAAAAAVPVTPQEVAYMAVAELTLPTVSPGIGPSPDINPWHIAVVGYPLWLWADGPTHVGPVSQAVANLSVSLDAHISSVRFTMGDGHQFTCTGAGTPWRRGMKPATPSPDCGYTYQQAAKHPYTVTATAMWAVNWEINGATGTIPIPRVSTVELPVGELQAVTG